MDGCNAEAHRGVGDVLLGTRGCEISPHVGAGLGCRDGRAEV